MKIQKIPTKEFFNNPEILIKWTSKRISSIQATRGRRGSILIRLSRNRCKRYIIGKRKTRVRKNRRGRMIRLVLMRKALKKLASLTLIRITWSLILRLRIRRMKIVHKMKV